MSTNSRGRAADPFAFGHETGTLRRLSVRGGLVTGVAQGLSAALNLTGLAVVARILGPTEYGLLAMVTAFTGLAGVLVDLGLSQATVQREQLTQQQVSTLFWINMGSALAAATLLCLGAPLISWFYGDQRLTPVTIALSGCFLLSGATAQHSALLRRAMRFGTVATLNVVGRAASVVTTIAMAMCGFGHWSLVVGQLVEPLCIALGSWMTIRWLPSRPSRAAGLRTMLQFGAHLSGATAVNYLARSADTALVGWAAGPVQLGLYSRAYQLLTMPTAQINAPMTAVALPALSRLQGDPIRYRNFYRRGVALLVSAGMPLCAFLFVDADVLIALVLGERWTDAAPIFRILAPAAFISTFNVATEWVYISLGRTDRLLVWGTISAAVRIACYAVGASWGAIGVATAYSLSVCVLRVPSIVYCFRGTPLTVADLIAALWRPAIASIAAATLLGVGHAAGICGRGMAIRILVDVPVYGVLYVGVATALPGGIAWLRGFVTVIRELSRRSSTAEEPGGSS